MQPTLQRLHTSPIGLSRRLRHGVAVLGFALGALFVAADADAQELRLILTTNILSIDPHPATFVGGDLSVDSHLYSSLIVMEPGSVLAPGLAKSWTMIDDKTWRFELVPGVKFPSGEAMTSDVVAWNVKRIMDPATKAANGSRYKLIQDVKINSPTSFDIITSAPFPALPAQLTMLYMMAPEWTKTHNPAIEAMGTGPYELVEMRAGERIVLKARADYWGDKPEFETVTFRIIPETAARVAAMLAGEMDYVTGFSPTEIARINASEHATADSVPSNRAIIIKFNSLKAPFKDNNKLRQAFNYAIDKQSIMEAMWHGTGALSDCQILSPMYFGYNPELKPYPYDPEKAKLLLAEAGYPGGKGLNIEFEVPRGRYLAAEDISQAVAAQLGEIGVTVNIVEREFASYFAKLQAGGMAEMGYIGTAWPTLDADGALTALLPGFPDAYYENDKFVELMNAGRVEMDVEKRRAIYAEATKNMCENPPVIFMANQPHTYALSDRVEWQVRGDDWVRAMDFSLKEGAE